MSIRRFIVATAAAGVVALFPAGAAGAASTSETPREVFQQLCEAKGGLSVFSPYALGRCQDARANKGFEEEQAYCESLGNAEFSFTISTRHMNRANWVCVSTVPVR